MSGSARLTGFRELMEQLKNEPAAIKAEAMGVIREETEGAAEEIRRHYPEASHTEHGTGRLARSVKTEYPSSTLLIGKVKASAKHSHLYEFGTQQRHNARGANRGRMPAKDVTVPIARRRRARMARRLIDLMKRRGYQINEGGG